MDLHAPLYLYDTTYCKGTEDSELCWPGPTGPIAASGEELLLLALQYGHEYLLCPPGCPMVILQDLSKNSTNSWSPSFSASWM